jgi:hypothetical protein
VASGELSSHDPADLQAYQKWSRDFATAAQRVEDALSDCSDSEFLSRQKQNDAHHELQNAGNALYQIAIDTGIPAQVAPEGSRDAIASALRELQRICPGTSCFNSWDQIKLNTAGPIRLALKGLKRRIERIDELTREAPSISHKVERIAPVQPDDSGPPALSHRAQSVLKCLLDAKAFDSDHRMTTAQIVMKAWGKKGDPNQFKTVIAGLKKQRYVETHRGRGGGCWLTAIGKARAEAL